MGISLKTGYFAREKQYREMGYLPVSIAAYTPQWYKGEELKSLAPSKELLNGYKNGTITEEEYAGRYLEYLSSDAGQEAIKTSLSKDLYKKALDGGYKGIVLMCYEKSEDFCHRHILAEYLNTKYKRPIAEELYVETKDKDDIPVSPAPLDNEKNNEEKAEEAPAPEQAEGTLYGSIHTHWESIYDTGNDLTDMVHEFVKAGAKRVAVTEHGDFTSFEEIKDIVSDKKMLTKDKKRPLEVIPGVEGYFNTTKDDETFKTGDEDRDHFILIAKDAEGYKYLSNIITRSNIDHDSKDRAVITWKNLEENIKEPGHLFCTTACIAGPLGKIFQDDEKEKKREIERYKSRIPFDDHEIEEIQRMDEEYINLTPKERKALSATEKADFQKNRKKFNVIKRNLDKIRAVEEKYSPYNIETRKNRKFEDAEAIYDRLTSIFGKDMVYLEIQNHGIEKEQEVYSGIIDFAVKKGIEDKLIASNDIHIGKVNPTETDYLRRNVAKFQRFNTYEPDEAWERELYIKTNETLKEWLMKLPVENPDKERLIDTAINNIEGLLSQCEVDYIYQKDKDHFPKFCENEKEFFDELIEKGIELKFPNGFPSKEYEERLEKERNIIGSMGYIGYHLIVQDYLDYGRYCGMLPDKLIPFAPLNLDELKKLVSEFEDIEDRVKSGAGFNLDDYPGAKALMDSRMTADELSEEILSNKYSTKSINIGPGRGSGVGSLCCYLLGITDIDPIPYDLLFERFLNPERVSMPDIDADFRPDIREKCIAYCAEKYGNGNTCRIITKGYVKPKKSLSLATRYLGAKAFEEVSPEDKKARILNVSDERTAFMKPYIAKGLALSKEIGDDPKLDTWEKVEKTTSFFSQVSSFDKQVYELASQLVDLYSNFGEHAAGDIISSDNISDIIPLKWNAKNKNYSTQCTMADAEAKGLLKMDFLGLDNLSILTDLIRMTGDDIINDYSKRSELLSDSELIKRIFSSALTQGIFQFESPGMKGFLSKFKPETFEDLILAVAIYRPGPMQYMDTVIAYKNYLKDPEHNEKPEMKLNLDNPVLAKILAPTYGCMIYQEQVMKICTDLSGYSMGQADIVRKYMSKKKLEPLQAERQAFIYGDPERNIEGCIKKAGMSEKDANDLFDQMLDFASYAFNKSHATAYALISFFTAYYKDKYPAEFYTVSLNHMGELSELAPFRSEMPAFNVRLHQPMVGKSKENFSASGNDIYFGLKSIKGMSDISLTLRDTFDETIKANPGVSAKSMIPLIMSGAFDSFGKRAEMASYVKDYHALILKKEDALMRKYTLLSGDAPDSRKLAGIERTLKNIGEIPDFATYKENCNTKEDGGKNAQEQYKLLGAIFFDRDTERTIQGSKSFKDLPDTKNKMDVEDIKVFCIGAESKEYRSKFNNQIYYAVTLMDKDYDTRRYFVPFKLKPGLYEGHLNQNPFSTLVDVKYFSNALSPIKAQTREPSACIKFKNGMCQQGQRTRIARYIEKNGNKPRYCVIYTGNRNSKVELGRLDKDEFNDFIKNEKENHNTEFIYGDEDITVGCDR